MKTFKRFMWQGFFMFIVMLFFVGVATVLRLTFRMTDSSLLSLLSWIVAGVIGGEIANCDDEVKSP